MKLSLKVIYLTLDDVVGKFQVAQISLDTANFLFDTMRNEWKKENVNQIPEKVNDQHLLNFEFSWLQDPRGQPVGERNNIEQLLAHITKQNDTEEAVDLLNVIVDQFKFQLPFQQLLVDFNVLRNFIGGEPVDEVLKHKRSRPR